MLSRKHCLASPMSWRYTHKSRTYPSPWTSVPAAPSNGSLAPPGDTEPGRKAETSLAPPVFASYLVLGKEEIGKMHSCTNPASRKIITATLSCTFQIGSSNFLGHISLSFIVTVVRQKTLHHTKRTQGTEKVIKSSTMQVSLPVLPYKPGPFLPKHTLSLLPLLLLFKELKPCYQSITSFYSNTIKAR